MPIILNDLIYSYIVLCRREETVMLLGTDVNGKNAYRTVRTTDNAEIVCAVLGLLTGGYSGDDCNAGVHETVGSGPNPRHWRNVNVVAMVNNLGGMPDVRFMSIVSQVADQIETVTGARAVHRWYAGRLMSSASNADDGFSVTVMDVGCADSQDWADEPVYDGFGPLMAYLDHPVSASGWPFACSDENLCPPRLPGYVRRNNSHLPSEDDDFPSQSMMADVLEPSFVTNILSTNMRFSKKEILFLTCHLRSSIQISLHQSDRKYHIDSTKISLIPPLRKIKS